MELDADELEALRGHGRITPDLEGMKTEPRGPSKRLAENGLIALDAAGQWRITSAGKKALKAAEASR